MPPVAVTIDVEHPSRPSDDPIRTLEDLVAVADDARQRINWFVQGRWALAYPDLVAGLAARGDLVGLHGYAHVDSRRLTERGFTMETRDGLSALRASCPGLDVHFCRLPFGQGTQRPGVLRVLEAEGLKPIGWDYSSFDWDEDLSDELSSTRMLAIGVTGGVALMHSWPQRSPLVLRRLLESLSDERTLLVSELELNTLGPTGFRMHEKLLDPPRG